MLDAASLAGKLDMLPDPKTLTIKLQNRPSTSPITISGCRRRPVDLAELAFIGNSGMAVPTSSFLIPAVGMGSNELLAGDLIVEPNSVGSATATWNVVHAQLELQTTIWRAFVARQS